MQHTKVEYVLLGRIKKLFSHTAENKGWFVGVFLALTLLVVVIWGVRLNMEIRQGYNLYALPFETVILAPDQTAQQTILHNWQSGYHETALMGENNWLLKWPLYVIVNNLPLEPTDRQFATSLTILSTVALGFMFGLTYLTYMLTGSRKRALYAAGVFALLLGAIPAYMFEYISWPNSRNIELVILLLLMVVVMRSEISPQLLGRRKQLVYTAASVLAALLFVNDPLFLYLTIPLGGLLLFGRYLFGVEGKLKDLRDPILYGLAAVVGSFIFRFFINTFLPVDSIVRPPNIFGLEGIFSSIKAIPPGVLSLLGVDSPHSGRFSIDILFIGLNALVLGAAVFGVGYWVARKPRNFSAHFLALFWLWNFALFIARGPDAVSDAAGNRYLMALYVFQLVGIVLAILAMRLKRQFLALVSVAAALFILMMGLMAMPSLSHVASSYVNRNEEVSQIINVLRENNLDKGYTDGIMRPYTYFSDHEVNALTATCIATPGGQRKLMYFDILSEVAIKNRYHADRTYYITNEVTQSGCKHDTLTDQLGSPSQIIKLHTKASGLFTISVYDYDISTVIPNPPSR